jgi:two-component system, cell cycle sensor histidine kinase and response regulator CckA
MTPSDLAAATRDELVSAYTASEARFRALFENAADVTIIVSDDGRIKDVSKSVSRLLGYERASLVGRDAFEFLHPEDEDRVRELLARAFAGDITQGDPFRVRNAACGWRLIEPVALNLLADPAVEGVVVTLRDVTGRHDLELRLRQAERLEAVGQLAGGIAHDFNNVLLVIRGYSSILKSSLADSPLAADVDEIASAADRAGELTRQLLAFARRQVLQPALLDLRDVVRGIEKLLRRSIREDITMSINLDQDVPPVLADAGKIEQVLVNLVVNARDAMPNGGEVAISIEPAILEPGARVSPSVSGGAYVAISVVDTGEGISADDLPYIFEPFFTTKEDGVGTGLGLSTVYGIVAQSGGGIEVAAPPSGGTRMTIYLPAAAGAVDEPDEEPAPVRLPVGHETILLVEDEDPVRELVCRVLEDAGYEVLPAARPGDAQRIVSETSIDLLLTDVVMPEMSGYDLALRVRLSQPDARTLFMSGYAHRALAEAEEIPGGELLRKPFSPDDLKRAVRAVLDGRPLGAAS